MLYHALTSFSGKVSMAMGEIGEIADPSIASDLLRAGLVEEWKADEAEKPAKKPAKKPADNSSDKTAEKPKRRANK